MSDATVAVVGRDNQRMADVHEIGSPFVMNSCACVETSLFAPIDWRSHCILMPLLPRHRVAGDLMLERPGATVHGIGIEPIGLGQVVFDAMATV